MSAAFGPVELQEPLELRLQPGQIAAQGLVREQRALGGLAGRIADETRPAAHHRDGSVAGALQAHQVGHGQQAADVERGRGGVEADVGGHALLLQELRQFRRGGLMHEAPATQVLEEVRIGSGAGHAAGVPQPWIGVKGPRALH
jgi:hypothetical protein